MLVLDQQTHASRLPETNRRQSIQLLAELLLIVDKGLSGKGGGDEHR